MYGAFLALVYCAHDPFARLDSYDSFAILERFLASNSGLVNGLITYCVAFIEGRVQPYRIAYTGADGSAGCFDKHLQNTQGPQPAERAIERWVVWNSDALASHGRWPTPDWSR